MNLDEARSRIEAAFRALTTANDDQAYTNLLPKSLTSGKLYEAYVLGKVAEKLVSREGFQLTLVNSTYIALKSAPGPINRSYPRIDIFDAGRKVAELWTDIEFLSLSHFMDRRYQTPTQGEYHELDIMIVEPGITGRPAHNQIWLGVECKNTGYQKGLLKEILGIRRELSLLQAPRATRFQYWPRSKVPADPPSCLVVYATDQKVSNYSAPGETFGIDFFHEELAP